MKKIAILSLIFAYIFSFYVAYLQMDYEQLEKVKNIEENLGKPFVIPNSLVLSDSDIVYPLLAESAQQTKVNIFRKSIQFQEDDQIDILKYVLITSKTKMFQNFNLDSGRWLTKQDTIHTRNYISTKFSNDPNQIGRIQQFGGNHLITIQSLQTAYHYLPVPGNYYVEASNNQNFRSFILLFTTKLNEYYAQHYPKDKISFHTDDFIPTKDTTEIKLVSFRWLTILNYASYIVYILACILLIYAVLNDSKKIGILKLHGISNMRIWNIVAGKWITITFISSVLLSLLIIFYILDVNIQFVADSLLYLAKAYFILIILSSLIYLYIWTIRIAQILKNMKDTKNLLLLNMSLKIACSILIILSSQDSLSQYIRTNDAQKELQNWNAIKDYGVFSSLKTGYDENDEFDYALHSDFYFLLNQKGALLANALMYEQGDLILNKDWKGIRSIKVNNNYLKRFPILNNNNEAIQISEQTSDWILLVPTKYQSRKQEILSFFYDLRKDYRENDESFYKQKLSSKIKNQKIKIIWTKNNQNVFSFNPEVFPSEHNTIFNPIIEVVTEKNSLYTDRDSVLGGGPSDPLKIKLINRDPEQTYQDLLPQLKKLKLDDNLKHLVTIDQYMLQQIYDQQSAMRESLLTLAGLIIALIFLVVQNLILFFNKHQSKFVVRRLFGTGFWRTYLEYFWLFSIIGIVQLVIAGVINRGVNSSLLGIMAIVLGIELIASIIALLIIEKKNKLKVIKGGS